MKAIDVVCIIRYKNFEVKPMAAKSNSITRNTVTEGLRVEEGASSKSDEESECMNFQKHEWLRIVPTLDEDVKASLRLLKQPEDTGEEDAFARRERLVQLVFNNGYCREIFQDSIYYKNDQETGKEEEEEEDFYTPASRSLINTRKFLIRFSLDRAAQRLKQESKKFKEFNMQREIKKRRHFATQAQNIRLSGAQVVATRPLSKVALCPNGSVIAVGSWAGDLTILNSSTLEILQHRTESNMGKIGGMHWNPAGNLIGVGGEDGSIRLYDYDYDTTLREALVFSGHESRTTDCQFHPSSRFIASASFDTTWRLWDMETQEELLLQEGHSKELYSLGIQCDGSLVCSAGKDCTGLVWDIRSGKCIMSLSGHARPIYSLEWSPNGYQLVTGSGDGTIRIWDLRRSGEYETILAHNSIVTKVAFEKNGNCLVSSGYDKSINVYGADNWTQLTTLKGHTDKILCVDIGENASSVVSCGWDRSVKLWT